MHTIIIRGRAPVPRGLRHRKFRQKWGLFGKWSVSFAIRVGTPSAALGRLLRQSRPPRSRRRSLRRMASCGGGGAGFDVAGCLQGGCGCPVRPPGGGRNPEAGRQSLAKQQTEGLRCREKVSPGLAKVPCAGRFLAEMHYLCRRNNGCGGALRRAARPPLRADAVRPDCAPEPRGRALRRALRLKNAMR